MGASDAEVQIELALDELAQVAGECGYGLDRAARSSLRCWVELVCEWRRAAGLTSARHPEEVVRTLMIPAVYALRLFRPGEHTTVTDLGAGSGATGVALALVSRQGRWFLVDRSRKKTTFCRYALSRCRITCASSLGVGEHLEGGVPSDVVLVRGLPKGKRTADTVRAVSGGETTVLKWVSSVGAPDGAMAVRCGDSDLWVVAVSAKCFT